MAVTQNTFTGDGSTQIFVFTFPYIEIGDIVVTVDDVVQAVSTDFQFANANTVSFITAPTVGTAVKIARNTAEDDLKHSFFPGSAIRAKDLNDNFTQAIYVVQEATFNTDEAVTAANTAISTANGAVTTANAAETTANQASTDATSALSGVTTAQSAATSAQSDATAAQTAATNAAADAAQAQADATQAASDAASALSAVQSGPVVSVSGQTGVVSLGIDDMTDVDTSSTNHVPADGQALVWDAAMGHWMPKDASIDLPTLPALP